MTDPFALFDEWLAEAHASEPELAEAMTVATADGSGRPSARIVLLKGHGPDGFVFYTNQRSRKGEELAYDYQLNIDGRVTKAMREAYACRCGAPRCRGTMLGRKRR